MMPQGTTANDDHQVRLFIAVPAPSETRSVVDQLRLHNTALMGTRWVFEANFHLTILFLGDIEVKVIPQIREILQGVLEKTSQSMLHFDRFSLEGSRKPSMVWARYQKNSSFAELAGIMREKLASLAPGISQFVDPIPHITLARIRSGFAPDISGIPGLPSIALSGFELWQTYRLKEGVRYDSIGKYYL